MNQVFLLGAGATRAFVGKKALLTDEIMPRLSVSEFPEVIRDFEKTLPDVEQFITLLDLRRLHLEKVNKSLSERLSTIRDNIAQQVLELFDLSQLHVEKLDDYPTLRRFIEIIPKRSHILSLNYDCVLDQGLYHRGRWSPRGGYACPNFPSTEDENKDKDDILLLKLHGSRNFRDSVIGGNNYFNVEIADKIFPGICANINTRESSLDAGAHVLVMSYTKKYHNGIMNLWWKAISSLREADKLIVVGCSLRDEDTLLRFALYHFGMRENSDTFLIDVINVGKENCNDVKEKLKNLIANPDKQEITTYEKGLDQYLSVT